MRQQLGHEGQQVACNPPVKPIRILHGVDEADGAVFGQDVIVTASIAGYGQPSQFSPAGKQIPPQYRVNIGCVRALPEDAARSDPCSPADGQPGSERPGDAAALSCMRIAQSEPMRLRVRSLSRSLPARRRGEGRARP
jgi:hypothetical protein